MDNFTVFDKSHITKALDAFMPGAAEHITPIAYRAWTPDIFLFLFRVHVNKVEYFFAMVAHDYLPDGKETVASILRAWDDLEVERYIEAQVAEEDIDEDGAARIDEIYKAHLVRLKKPTNLGYWSSYVTITKDSDLDKELSDFTASIVQKIKNLLIENENYVINVYKNDDGGTELFYN